MFQTTNQIWNPILTCFPELGNYTSCCWFRINQASDRESSKECSWAKHKIFNIHKAEIKTNFLDLLGSSWIFLDLLGHAWDHDISWHIMIQNDTVFVHIVIGCACEQTSSRRMGWLIWLQNEGSWDLNRNQWRRLQFSGCEILSTQGLRKKPNSPVLSSITPLIL